MNKFTDRTMKTRMKKEYRYIDLKEILCILAVEAGMFLLAAFKGIGLLFLPVVVMMMIFTIIGCVIVEKFRADRVLFILVLVLLNLGFLIQQIQDREEIQFFTFSKKLLVAIVAAVFGAFLYVKVMKLLEKDIIVLLLMAAQIVIGCAMVVLGKVVGSMSAQGARISLFGITPLEIVKVLYVFVVAGLLCSNELDQFVIGRHSISKELVLVVHTMILSMIFLLCSELGTMMIVYFTGLIMLGIYGKNRKWIIILIIVTLAGFLAGWALCDMVLLPLAEQHPGMFPGIVEKMIYRFGRALHPELDMLNTGYQGTCSLEAISVGGWLGIGAELFRIPLPEASNDFIFANIIETCGVAMGIIVMLFMFVFLRRGLLIASRSENAYLQGVAVSTTLIIVIEAIIHIGYNNAVFPISGIPLYFLSQGFTAIITGMVLVAVLLVISADNYRQEG